VEGQKEEAQDCVHANLNTDMEVNVDNDVHINVKTTLEKNVDANGEHQDKILLETIEDSNDDEQLTYISVHDKIKSLADPRNSRILRQGNINMTHYILCFWM